MRVKHLVPLFVVLVIAGMIAVSCGGAEEEVVIGEAPIIRVHTDQRDIDEDRLNLDDLIERGRLLMVANFNTLDGAGRPTMTGTGGPRDLRIMPDNFNRISGPDANSCAGCHNMPRPGGGGDNVANVFVLAQRLPFVNFDGSEGEEFKDLTLKNVGNERATLGMFGSGFIELLAREMTAALQKLRDEAISTAIEHPVTVQLLTKGVDFGEIVISPDGTIDTSGVQGIDSDLIVKPFHQKGVVVSLREFTTNAINLHHGLQANERFGVNHDEDGDGVVNEITAGDMTALTIFLATLSVPGQVMPAHPKAREAVERGRELLETTGCTVCHIPELPLFDPVFTEPNPFNPDGNLRPKDVGKLFTVDLTKEGPGPHLKRGVEGIVMVPAFTDLKRHKMGDALNNEQIVQDGVPTDEWLTRKLWGMSSEPPFLHHGRATLISEAILAHGGEAEESRKVFAVLPPEDQDAIVEFLKSLQVLPEGTDDLVITAESD